MKYDTGDNEDNDNDDNNGEGAEIYGSWMYDTSYELLW